MDRRSFLNGLFTAVIAASSTVALISEVEAHPGALDSNGCHHVRRTGAYVCHAGRAWPGHRRRFIGWGGGQHNFQKLYRRRRHRRHR